MVDIGCRKPGVVQRRLPGLDGQARGGAADVALADARAFDDPAVAGVEAGGQVVVGHDLVRHGDAAAGDADASHAAGPRARPRPWMAMKPASPSMMPPELTARPNRARPTWRPTARPRNWLANSTTWASPVAPRGCPGPPGRRGVDHQSGCVDAGVARFGGRAGLPDREEPERLEGVDLLGRRGVVQLDQVDVGGAHAGGFPGGVGGLGHSVVVVEESIAGAGHRSDDTRGGGRGGDGGAGHDGGGRSVGEGAAHESGQDARHLRRRQHLLNGRACAGTGPAGCGPRGRRPSRRRRRSGAGSPHARP